MLSPLKPVAASRTGRTAADDLQPARLQTCRTRPHCLHILTSGDPIYQCLSLPGTPLLTLTGPRLSVCRRRNRRTVSTVENGSCLRVPDCQHVPLAELRAPVGVTGRAIG